MSLDFSDSERAGPYRLPPARRDATLDALANQGIAPLVFAAPQAVDRKAWLSALGTLLCLPASFGANFDALFDTLTDEDCIDAETLVLILEPTRVLDEAAQDTLIAVFQAVADEWRRADRAFWVLFADSRIELDDLPG